MLKTGPALRVIMHLNQDIAAREDYLHNDILHLLQTRGMAGATVFRPYAGFGLHGRVHRKDASGVEGEHLPIRIEFVDEKARVESLLPELCNLLTDGMIEVQETTVVKIAGEILRQQHGNGPNG